MEKLELPIRPRRLRSSAAMRSLLAQTQLRPEQLMQVFFVRDGISQPQEIPSMPGQYQHTLDSLLFEVEQALAAGLRSIDLFGVPLAQDKDDSGSAAWAEGGILNRAISRVREEFADDLVIMADTCLDEFTSHGHCGPLRTKRSGAREVDNDAAVASYCAMALAQAEAGAHMVSPSGMMDGQVAAIRSALDRAGYEDVAIMAYSAKYASAFFGPFRDAVGSSLTGDRRSYQQDPANAREGLLEVELDIEQGADIVMVKPAMAYLDLLRQVADFSRVPVAAYQVSGEYAMIEAAASRGWIDRKALILESLTGIKRAGADIILTYYATEVGRWLKTA
ncbi:MAG: porphobilinogen synthase [Rothia sp. (in: high G+C Gram-positive bacteria)]|nr:porphobilinogen synthase [Rothia sp. (in: high G+C Gram-positive bacteria)]